jgi:hypothetical protein
MLKRLLAILGVSLVLGAVVYAGADDDPTGWMGGNSGASANFSLSLVLAQKYFMNVDKTEDITGFTYDIDTSGDDPTIKLDNHIQIIGLIDAISNDKTGYIIKATSSSNTFALKNSDSIPASIPYTLQVASGTNYTGASSINSLNGTLITVGAASSLSDLYVNGAELKINIPEVSNLIFDSTTFSDTLTIAIAAE